MSAGARANGWRGFDGLGERVERGGFGHEPKRGGYMYRCDGMPTPMGCGEQIIIASRWSKVGKKTSGWLVCYGLEPETNDTSIHDKARWHPDEDVVLTYCPSCADEVKRQETAS